MRNLRRIQRRNHNFDTISWNPNRKQEHGTDQEGQFIWPASMGQLRTGRYMLRRASGSGWDRAWLCRQKSLVFGGRRGTFSGAPPPRLSRWRPNFYTPRSLRGTLSLLSFIPLGWVLGELCRRPPFSHRYNTAGHKNKKECNHCPQKCRKHNFQWEVIY